MIFSSRQIRGEGRGHKVGFPTINLLVPSNLILDDGIYAAWVAIGERTYKGALHYGAIPTFDKKEKTMEVHLLDVTDENAPNTENVDIEIDIVSHIRNVWKFGSVEELATQIDKDVKDARAILA